MANPKTYATEKEALDAASEALDFDRPQPPRDEYVSLDLRSLNVTPSAEDAARFDAALAAMDRG